MDQPTTHPGYPSPINTTDFTITRLGRRTSGGILDIIGWPTAHLNLVLSNCIVDIPNTDSGPFTSGSVVDIETGHLGYFLCGDSISANKTAANNAFDISVADGSAIIKRNFM